MLCPGKGSRHLSFLLILSLLSFHAWAISPLRKMSFCEQMLTDQELEQHLALNSIGKKLEEDPRLMQRFAELERKRDDFELWYFQAVRKKIEAKHLSAADTKIAHQKNAALVAELHSFASAVGIRTTIVALNGFQGIKKTTALQIDDMEHPFFRELRADFPDFQMVWDPLRSFLHGGVRGTAGGRSPGTTHFMHLYDFPLLISDLVLHKTLLHETVHWDWADQRRRRPRLYESGEAWDMDGMISVKHTRDSINDIGDEFRFDELTATLLTVRLAATHLRLAKIAAQKLPRAHPARYFLNPERQAEILEFGTERLEKLLSMAHRVFMQIEDDILVQGEDHIDWKMDFDTGVERGQLYLTLNPGTDNRVNKAVIRQALLKNLEDKRNFIEGAWSFFRGTARKR